MLTHRTKVNLICRLTLHLPLPEDVLLRLCFGQAFDLNIKHTSQLERFFFFWWSTVFMQHNKTKNHICGLSSPLNPGAHLPLWFAGVEVAVREAGFCTHSQSNRFTCRTMSVPADYNYWYNSSLICAPPSLTSFPPFPSIALLPPPHVFSTLHSQQLLPFCSPFLTAFHFLHFLSLITVWVHISTSITAFVDCTYPYKMKSAVCFVFIQQ